MTLDAGQPLPDFDLPTDGDGRLTKADLAGKAFVLYLYPKDDTSGCTKEALAFQGLEAEFAALGVTVIGLSKDGVKSHDKFKTKHGLGFPLLSDETGAFVEALGAWVEKSMYGKKYMGIDRSTFLVDANGTIAQVWRSVKVSGHAEAVLEAAKGLVKQAA
ncbi:MAG: peroxiredoxin [Geminicoccaceae bacterium]|nr:MAG: peroxiredoxin [Geminicoccaceae bacterium]